MDRNEQIEVLVPAEFEGERVDRFLASSLELDMSRNYIQKLIGEGLLKVNDGTVKSSYRCREDDRVTLFIPAPEELKLIPWEADLDFLYRDDHVAVINKPAGMLVHPGAGNRERTLVNALVHHFDSLPIIGGEYRPGIVHRLDRDTAGVMVIALTEKAHRSLSRDFAERNIEKRYLALVTGRRNRPEGMIELPLGRHPKYGHKMTVRDDGREARTGFRVVLSWEGRGEVFTALEVNLHTGRTHQIRVHLSATGTPVVADPIYSKKWKKYREDRLMLQSMRIAFMHPVEKKRMTFSVPPADHIRRFLVRWEGPPPEDFLDSLKNDS